MATNENPQNLPVPYRPSIPRKYGYKKSALPNFRIKSDEDQVYTRQREDREFFDYSTGKRLIKPFYNPDNLYIYAERGDVLRTCVSVMEDNIHGFGYTLKFLGDDRSEKDKPNMQIERLKLDSFLKQCNHDQSFQTVAKLLRADYEYTGNAALEVIRNMKNEIEALYHVPIRTMRMGPLPIRPIIVPIKFLRNGKAVELRRKIYFRYFAQKLTRKAQIVYYKEFGDPRTMNSLTGEYVGSIKMERLKQEGSFEKASEILWIKQHFGGFAYGVPRWIATLFEVLGRHNVSAVNYNLVKKGGIPQLIITVNGGTLTEESYGDLMEAIEDWRSTEETWNQVVVLESVPESVGLEDKGTAKIDLKFMTEGRKDDIMFESYKKEGADAIRKTFRFAPLYLGGTEDYNRATAVAAMKVSEQQSFQPEREEFDEIVNFKIVKAGLNIWNWEYKSNKPRVIGDDEFRMAFDVFAKWGAITLNDAIDVANSQFGMEMSKYKEPWGNYPLAFVMELVKQDKLNELDDIKKEEKKEAPPTTQQSFMEQGQGQEGIEPDVQGEPAFQTKQPRGKPSLRIVPKAKDSIDVDSDLFSPEEREAYSQLVAIQETLDNVNIAKRITEENVTRL